MATLTELREGIAARLDTIPGLRVHATVPDSINPPAATVRPEPGGFADYSTTAGGQSHDVTLVVTVFAGSAVDRTAQDTVDAYVSPTGASSVYAAIEGDPTLGGVADWAHVVSARNYGPFTFAGVDYFGCEFVVVVGA